MPTTLRISDREIALSRPDKELFPADHLTKRGDMADHLAEQDPDLLTTAPRKDRRGDRIFLDVNRNAYGQTSVAPYSLRSRPGAPVATPLDWSELGRATPDRYDPRRIRRRLARKADPWAAIGEHASSPATARRRLDAGR